ncbi:MAG: hypothetical protein CV087_07565 [Candidatus Brocadia sp. WS118]|nr:MAG: hypothetical protein CV087_07565 [Candidatus Brocadia sp. WS118]
MSKDLGKHTNAIGVDLSVGLTRAEEGAISNLKKLAKKWPKTLWLWSGSGSLFVMKYSLAEKPDGRIKGGTSVDAKGIVERIDGIPNDGGDW